MSLRSNADTWLSTVRTEMHSRSAISWLVSRPPITARTSASRAVTPAAASLACPAGLMSPILADTTEKRSVLRTDARPAARAKTYHEERRRP